MEDFPEQPTERESLVMDTAPSDEPEMMEEGEDGDRVVRRQLSMLLDATENFAEVDQPFTFDKEEYESLLGRRPWAADVNYFKSVRVSALALLKMAIHANSGGETEIMGLLQGKVEGSSFIVIDAIPLPVTGTETRVSAHEEANVYIIDYHEAVAQIGRNEYSIGWYHSHPGYGCWLSGIDVTTQRQSQILQDPWVALVIDPKRLLSGGKVEIGAFRTYPANHRPVNRQSEFEDIPIDRIEEFGVHADSYYSLNVSFFKSLSDSRLLSSLWHTYWISALSSSSLLKVSLHLDLELITSFTHQNVPYTAERTRDLAAKIGSIHPGQSRRFLANRRMPNTENGVNEVESLAQESAKAAMETSYGLMNEFLKDGLFGSGNL